MHTITKNILGLVFILLSLTAYGQSTQVEFGKNRVQFHDDFDEWSMYESENFITYWYGEGRNIGQSVVQMAETDFQRVQDVLEHRVNTKMNIIVYKDITDLQQSNIGSEEVFYSTTGKTKIVGNKIFIYFDGNHNNLRRSVREGIATAYLNAMLFGASLQEVVQNAVMLNLPEWFKEGLIGYAGEAWSYALDDELRNVFKTEVYDDFEVFTREEPRLAGHALFYYIRLNYGASVIPNLVYLTRINRSVKSGFYYVFGEEYDKVIADCYAFYQERYQKDIQLTRDPDGKELEIKNRRKLPISTIKLSPNTRKIAYVLNEIGKVKVYVQDVNTGKRKRILKFGSRNPFQETDYEYPLLAWSPNNQELCIIYEKRDVIQILRYNVQTGTKQADIIPNMYQRIHSIDFLDPNQVVFSATVGGVSDIYLFHLNTRQSTRITKDFWDDLDASVVKVQGRKGIMFASNRLDTVLSFQKLDSILPDAQFDLYYYDLDSVSNELVRLTNTPLVDERNPQGVDTTWYTFLSEASGIANIQKGYIEPYLAWNNKTIYLNTGDSIVLHEDSLFNNVGSIPIDSIVITPVYKKRGVNANTSNYNTNVISHHLASSKQKRLSMFKVEDRHMVYLQPIDAIPVVSSSATVYRKELGSIIEPSLEENISLDTLVQQESKLEKIEEGYLFQSEFGEPEKELLIFKPKEGQEDVKEIFSSINPLAKSREVHKFNRGRIIPYKPQFRTDFFTTTVDNSLLFGGLNSYAGTGQEYTYPDPGLLFKANFKDLFEDYVLEGGFRLLPRFNTEYYLFFDNKKKQLDKRFALYHRRLRGRENYSNITNRFTEIRSREVTSLAQLELRYPLDIFRSIRGTTTFRMDKQTQLSTDRISLNTPSATQERIGFKLEYVFDNTLDVSTNIKNGTRYKVYAEVVKKFNIDFIDNFEFDLAEGFMTILGFDARHYERLLKHSVLALRAAGATTVGSEKILFMMGGVDNWLFPSFNNQIALPSENNNIAYQAFANNLRGFKTNIRNGNSYALVNAELRIPVLKYIFPRSKSTFVNSFQVVGFADAGTAWEGRNPFSEDNPLNIVTVSNGPVSVTVNYSRQPIVYGYGFGGRTNFLGYFLKVDYAWGVESNIVQDPILYLSIGKDF